MSELGFVRGIITRGDELLVCYNTKNVDWNVPGGKIEPGESAAAAMARELWEETGLDIGRMELLFSTDVAWPAKIRRGHYFLVHPLDLSKMHAREAPKIPILKFVLSTEISKLSPLSHAMGPVLKWLENQK